MRIAYFSPLPPQRSGIADYSAELLPLLARDTEIALVVEDGFWPDAALAAFPLLSVAEFERRRLHYDVSLYQMGNSLHHAYMLRALRSHPGIVVLHEVFLHHGIADSTAWQGDFAGYVREMGYSYGIEGVRRAQAVRRGEQACPLFELPLNERVLDLSLGVIVHSAYARAQVLASRPQLCVAHIPQGTPLPPPMPEARARLGLPHDALIVASFGLLTPEKQIEPTLRAFAHLRARRPEALFLLVGEVLTSHPPLAPQIAALGLEGAVIQTGRVPDLATFAAYIAATDIAVNLRHPTLGETSASLLRVMAGGVPAVVSDAGWYAELPDEACVKVLPDGGVEALAEALQMLSDDPQRRRSIGVEAREYIARAHRWEDVAAAYLAFIREVLAG
jgi:glycosyltransferase involved in cell wall biosynthesis